MGRYYYSPVSYHDYTEKYLNSLKTGELLVDLDQHDLYVTEEGYNIPMPTTPELKERIVKYLENTIEGINFRKSEVPLLIKNIEKIKEELESRQNIISEEYEGLEGHMLQDLTTNKYLNKITQNNINQLGDLKLTVDEIDFEYLDERIFELIDEFNLLNMDFRSNVYIDDANTKNAMLMEIWTDIQKLMDESNKKLKRMGSFDGSLTLKKNVTKRNTVYDAYYTKRQFNFTLGGHPDIGMRYRQNYQTQQQYLDGIKMAREGFIKWFYGQKYLDQLTRKRFPGMRGSGLWYKGFATKRDEQTGSLNGRRHEKWDLFENVPLEGQNNAQSVNTPTVAYVRSPTNFVMFENANTYSRNNSTGYSYRTGVVGAKIISYNMYGNQTWQKDYRHVGSSYRTNNDLLKRIVGKDDGTQRTPKYFYNNKDRMSSISPGAPSWPIVVRDYYWLSHTGLANREAMNLRVGLKKTLSTTEISTARYGFNDTRGWYRR